MAKKETLSSGYIRQELLKRNESYLGEYEGLKPLMTKIEADCEYAAPASPALRKLLVIIEFGKSEKIQNFHERWGLTSPMNPHASGCIDYPMTFEARENGDGVLIRKGDLVIAIPPQYRPAELKRYFDWALKAYREREKNIPASQQRICPEAFIEQLQIYDKKKGGMTFGQIARKLYGKNYLSIHDNKVKQSYYKIVKQIKAVKP